MSLSKQVQRTQVQSAKQSSPSAQAPIDPLAQMMAQMMAMMASAKQSQASIGTETTVSAPAAQQSIQGKKKRRQNVPSKVKLSLQAEVGYTEFTGKDGNIVRKHVVGFPRGYDKDGNPQFGSGAVYGDSPDVLREKVRSMAIALGLIAE